jgi:hypothetical protein
MYSAASTLKPKRRNGWKLNSGMLDNTRGSIERWVDSLTGMDQIPLAAIRLATEQIETALNRLQMAPIADARFDPNALQDCAERVARIADRLRSIAQHHAH